MISASLRLCADSSPARVPAVPSHASPGRSPCRPGDQNSASRSCRRTLELSSRAVPSDYDAFSNGRCDHRAVPGVPSSNSQAMVGREQRSPRVAGVMCSPFRQLLTSSSPDIHTLHSVLIKLHRSEATTADLTHSGQSIGLLYSLASDTASANADSADMATAILASLATSPAARCQLPVHAREQLTDALVLLVNKDARAAPSLPAGTSQPDPSPHVPSHFPLPTTSETQVDTFSVHGILHSELPPVSPLPSVQALEAGLDDVSPAALAQAVAEKFAHARDGRPGCTSPPAPVVTELADSSAFGPGPHRQREAHASSREPAGSEDHIPCPAPEEPAGESPTPAVFRKMSSRTSAFLRASQSPPTSAAASAVSLATAATRVSNTRPPPRAAQRVAPQVAPAPAPSVPAGVAAAAGAAPPAPPPAAAPPQPGHSLRDSESDAATVTAVSLFLSKCGLMRSSLTRTMPLAGVLSTGGAVAGGAASGQRAAEVEESARRAGRRSAAALALGAAAAADEVMLRHFHSHNIPQVRLCGGPLHWRTHQATVQQVLYLLDHV